MSRGGRGGGRGGRGGMHRNPLPFDVDPDLFDGAEGAATGTPDENTVKQLYPRIDLPTPRPVTEEERVKNRVKKELQTETKKSVWWTGTKEQIDGIRTTTKVQAKRPLDAFDSMETYSKKKRAKPDAYVPVEKRKFPKINAELTPAEVRPGEANTSDKKKGGSGAKKSVTDRLANINENRDDEGGDADDESVDGGAKAGVDDGEDAASEPQDSEFEEDEADDADNDYNAENYFSGGEGDDGSVGGEDGDDGY